MKSTSDEKTELIESETPQEEYKTKKRYDLHELTKGKTLVLFRPQEKTQFTTRLNKTLLNLIRMHCENEDIQITFFLETALVDFLKRNKIISCRIIRKYKKIDPEDRLARKKRITQYRKTLREMRGLRTILKKNSPKKKKLLKIEAIKDYRREE